MRSIYFKFHSQDSFQKYAPSVASLGFDKKAHKIEALKEVALRHARKTGLLFFPVYVCNGTSFPDLNKQQTKIAIFEDGKIDLV